MSEEKVVDTTQETQETPEVTLDQLQTQVKDLKEQNDYLSNEAKKAFEKRDKTSERLKTLKETTNSNEDLAKYVQQLELQVKEKDTKLQSIQDQTTRTEKMVFLKEVARKQGIKPAYLDSLDKFVDLNEVNTEKEVSARIAVDSVKNSYPDLFSANSETVDLALPNPKLTASGAVNYKEQYNALLQMSPHLREQNHFDKLAELKALIVELS